MAQNLRILKCICHANLDAMWSIEPITVKQSLMECKRGLQIAATLGFRDKLFKPLRPFPLEDKFGMSAAIVILQVLLNPGINDKHE